MIKLIKKLYNIFYLSDLEKKLYKLESNKSDTNEGTILVQCVEDYFYYGLFGEVVSRLRKSHKIKVDIYTVRCLTHGSTSIISSFIKSVLLNNRFRDNKWIRLYKSFSNSVAYRHEGSTSLVEDFRFFFEAKQIFNNLKTKRDVLELIIDDIDVGELIYDSYLRFKPAPTVDIKDIYLLIVIWQAIRNVKVARRYFNKSKPLFVLNSYSTYIQHGITARLAIEYGVKVYTFGNFQSLYKELCKKDFYHTAAFKNYKKGFDSLDIKEKLLNISKKNLESRFSGEKDTATLYMKQSAYINNNIEVPKLDGYIVVFLHDFFDSPHVYGNIIFPDFLEWIEFTISTLISNNIKFALKPHPNQQADSKKVIEDLKRKYDDLEIISPKITNLQLIEAGISTGVSAYGTVAHELIYLGVPTILCAKSPHSSFSFCNEAKTIKEYEDMLKNHNKLNINKNSKEEIEAFYYMHNLNNTEDEKELLKVIGEFRRISDEKDEMKKYEMFEKYTKLIRENKSFINHVNEML